MPRQDSPATAASEAGVADSPARRPRAAAARGLPPAAPVPW